MPFTTSASRVGGWGGQVCEEHNKHSVKVNYKRVAQGYIFTYCCAIPTVIFLLEHGVSQISTGE